MNKIYYLNSGFYVEGASAIPEKAVEVTEWVYNKFAGVAWPEGKMLGADAKGLPAWVDLPPPTDEELISLAASERSSKINGANDYINSRQWPSKLALGRLSDEDKYVFNLWLDYLDNLVNIDISDAPNIKWPEPPND